MRKQRNSAAKQTKGESSYTKQQRRRAENIIKATGVYSAAFRNEVQQALDHLPHKLPVLFREAERIDQRLESAGRSIRATLRKDGFPVGEPSKPLSRSPKNVTRREAEEIESVLIQYETGKLNEEMADRAELIGNVLFDIGNEAGVNATHPQLVKAYYLALSDALPFVERRTYERLQQAFAHVRDLMNGCSKARYEEIDAIYNPDHEAQRAAYFEEKARTGNAKLGDEVYAEAEQARAEIEAEATTPENDGIVALSEKLARLEDLPENEAVAFRLESRIYRLEHKTDDDEWPDVIGGGADGTL